MEQAEGTEIKPYKPNDIGNMIFTEKMRKKLERFKNIKKVSELTDEDIRELILVIIDMIPNLTATFLGIKPKVNKKQKRKMLDQILPSVRKFLKTLEEAEKYPDNQEKTEMIVIKACDEFSKEAFGKPFIDYIIKSYEEKALNIKELDKFFKGTEFIIYYNVAQKLINELNSSSENILKTNSLFKNGVVSEDILYTALLPSKLFNNTEWINKPVKRWTPAKLQKVNDVYGSLSSIYEKQARLVRALIKIADNDGEVDYNTIHNDSLANNVNAIKKHKKYGKLGDIDIIMRNAIHHYTILSNINTKTITYKDRQKNVTYSYAEVMEKTRNLSALIYSIILMQTYSQYLNVLRVRKALDTNADKNKLKNG